MDPTERRKLMRGVGEILDKAETWLGETGERRITKIAGENWQAYVYEPNGPGSRSIHIEVKVAAE